MARRKSGCGRARTAAEAEVEDDGWPLEWTCASLVALVVAVVALLGRFAPSLFAGQCTTLSGMCTPAQCSCPAPLRKHELVTGDEQACFRCIEEFCPAVTEGEEACTTLPCECEDPSWPRVAVQHLGGIADDGQASCWQCVRPSLDFTVRAGSGNDSCLSLAPSPAPALAAVGAHTDAAPSATAPAAGTAATPSVSTSALGRRLVTVRERAACAAVRFNGARILERGRNGSCLVWQTFGAFWSFADCDAQDARMQFESLLTAVTVEATGNTGTSPPPPATYCSIASTSIRSGGAQSINNDASTGNAGVGPTGLVVGGTSSQAADFCVEVAERLCTEEEGRCSTEQCRCSNLSWTRLELQTLQDAQRCFNCVPPAVHCATAVGACTPGPCDCADGTYVKVLGNVLRHSNSEDPDHVPCFRCEAQWGSASLGAPSLAFFGMIVLVGLSVGCCVRRLLDARGAEPLSSHEQPESWSERWARELEYTLEDLYELFVETPAAFLRWLRPHVRQVGRGASWLLDYFDVVMEPCYCAVDWGQEVMWNCMVSIHERIVMTVLWFRTTPAAKGKSGKRLRPREDRKNTMVDGLLENDERSLTPPNVQKTRSKGHHSKSNFKPPHQLEGDPLRIEVAQVMDAPSQQPESDTEPVASEDICEQQALTWDPLNLTGKLVDSKQAAVCAVSTPDRIRMQELRQSGAATLANPEAAANLGSATNAAVNAASKPGIVQSRMQRKLQQRREALAQRGTSGTGSVEPALLEAQPELCTAIDDSWIDELEREVPAPRKEAKAAKVPRERRRRNDGRRDVPAAPPSSAGAAAMPAPLPTPIVPRTAADAPLADARAHNVDEPITCKADESHEEEQGERQEDAEGGGEASEDEEARESGGEDAGGEDAPEGDKNDEGGEDAKVQESKQGPLSGHAEPKDVDVQVAVAPSDVPNKKESGFDDARRAWQRRSGGIDTGRPELLAMPEANDEVHTSSGESAPAPDGVGSAASPPPVMVPTACAGSGRTLAADAPEFVPAAFVVQQQADGAKAGKQQKKKKQKRQEGEADALQAGVAAEGQLTTVVASGLAPGLDTNGLRKMLDAWGLGGTYDFLFIFVDQGSHENMGDAIINFVDPAFVFLLCWLYQQMQMAGAVVPAEVQGLKANQEHWLQYGGIQELRFEVTAEQNVGALGFRPCGVPPQRIFIEAVEAESWAFEVGIAAGDELMALNGHFVSDMAESDLTRVRRERPLRLTLRREERLSEPVIIPNPTPSQWAVNSINEMIAPHVRGQFWKTKMCVFHSQSRCEMGASCPFAHSQDELMPVPDLAKTKLCYNYFCKRCTDPRCKFAHGSQELRSDWLACAPAMYMWGTCDTMCYPPLSEFQAFEADPTGLTGFQGVSSEGFMQGMVPLMGAVPLLSDGAHSSTWLSSRRISEQLNIGSGAAASRAGSSAVRSSTVRSSGSQAARGEAIEALIEEPLRRSATVSLLPVPGKQVMLREYGTFMESMHMREDLMEGSRQRSWSDSDLPAFREAMEDSVLG